MENENENGSGVESVKSKGGAGGKPDLMDFYWADLPNSSQFERVCRDLGKRRDQIQALIPEFRASTAETFYGNLDKLATHFKRWYNKRQTSKESTKSSKLDGILEASDRQDDEIKRKYGKT